MAAKKMVQKAETMTAPPKVERSYYFLKELEPLGYSVEALLDLGISQKLVLSFVVAGRTIYSGHYIADDGETECHQADGVYSGFLSLAQDQAWKILADGQATIEYLRRTDTDYSKFEHSDATPLPVVSRENLVIKETDLKRFTEGLPAVPVTPSVVTSAPKRSEKLTIGALAYLYAKVKTDGGSKAFLSPKGDVVVQRVADDVLEVVETGSGPMQGAGKTSVYSLISLGTAEVKTTATKNLLKDMT